MLKHAERHRKQRLGIPCIAPFSSARRVRCIARLVQRPPAIVRRLKLIEARMIDRSKDGLIQTGEIGLVEELRSILVAIERPDAGRQLEFDQTAEIIVGKRT